MFYSNVQTQITNLTGTVGQLNDTNSQVMKFYNAINTGGNYGTIISIGNFTVPDYTGSSIHIKLIFHAGYNGLNSQDYVTDIFFKVSNRDSADTPNFPANSWYYRYGQNGFNMRPFWVINETNTLNFKLYVYAPGYTYNSYYEVSYSQGCSFNNDISYLSFSVPTSSYPILNSIEGYNIYSPIHLTNATIDNYQTVSGMSNYLSTSNASATYQPISGMSNYLTTSTATSIYQTIANMSSYVLNSSLSTTLSNYITISSLSTTLSNYVLNSNLSTTLSNYITNSSLSTILSGYLTTSSASSTYLTIADAAATYLSNSSNVIYVNSTNTFNDGRGQYTINQPLSKVYMINGGIQQLTLSNSPSTTSSSGTEILILTNLSFYNQNNFLYGNIQLNNGTIVTSIPLSKNATFRFLYYKGTYYQL